MRQLLAAAGLALVTAACGTSATSDDSAATSDTAPIAAEDAAALLLTVEEIAAEIPEMGELHEEFRGPIPEDTSDDSASEDSADFTSDEAVCQEFFDRTAANPRTAAASLVADDHETQLLITHDIYLDDAAGIMADAETAQGCSEYAIGPPLNATVTTEPLDLSAEGWGVVADRAVARTETFGDSVSATAFAERDDVVVAVLVQGGDNPEENLGPFLDLALAKYDEVTSGV